ncbi:MAG TPA: FtsK/SpoIIIE domain-containing protein [Jatrophihabitans sp.]|nr:FtsK/SpoIIIE domain-containing protein [Jatrophihabitans sp.]
MRIELTLSHGDAQRDIAVVATSAADLATLRAEFARTCAAPDDSMMWSRDRALPPTALLGEDGLRTGSIVSVGTPAAAAVHPGLLTLHIVGGPDSGRMLRLERGRYRLGRGRDCEVRLRDPDASRQHASIEVTATSVTLRDLDSTNGTYLDGEPVAHEGVRLRPTELIRIGDTFLSVAGPDDAPAALHAADDGQVLVLRPPRRSPQVEGREIALPDPGSSARPRGVQWITALLPAGAGCAIAWFSNSPQFLLFALLSPLMMMSSSLGDRVHWRRSRRREAASFARRSAAAHGAIRAGLADETAARRAAAPDPAHVQRLVSLPGGRLWERSRDDADLLRVRLGTADLPSTLRTRQGAATHPAGVVTAVPLSAELRDGPLGVAGPADVVAGIGRWLVGQLAASHSPTELQLALLLSPAAAPSWFWARWLPHLQARVAVSGDEWQQLVKDVTTLAEQRRRSRRLDPSGWRGPWLVIVVDRVAALADVPGLADVLERGSAVGITAICVDEHDSRLPTSCISVARVVGANGTRLSLRTAHSDTVPVVADQVSPSWAEELARGLAPLVDAGAAGSSALADGCQLREVLGAGHLEVETIAARWMTAGGNARTVLGLSADGPLPVDLVADGPHALIAGTTGAGKSELLQTLVVGLAAHHPPDDVNFLLIDYKGGAAFADCARLPHTAGLVTDLDAHLTARALCSLNSELRRRERLFADTGASDLMAYRASGPTTPLARLVIVVDEFAALADELPDFVRGLVGVAQRGRSLGVHLVLATQRPGSAISPEIRANTTLRIALRVADPAESTDVIGAVDAALIERSQPGRAYVRTGSTLTCIQAAHAAAPHRPVGAGPRVEILDPWRRGRPAPADAAGETDLSALVAAIRAAADRAGRARASTPWLPPLPQRLPSDELNDAGPLTSIPFGLVDLPAEQRRETLTLDLTDGTSLLVSGAPRTGRTAALTSIALAAAQRLGPQRLQLYVIDPTAALAGIAALLPHCASVAGPDEPELALRLLGRLDAECARRVAARGAGTGPVDAPMLLLIDGWQNVLASLGDAEATVCADLLASLLRAGAPAGLTVVVAGDRTVLAPRFSGAFAAKLVLRLADVADYGLAGISPRDVPAAMPPGRALRAADAAVVQLAHDGVAVDAGATAAGIASSWATSRAPGLDQRAIRVRPLPRHVCLADLPVEPGRMAVGVVGDAAVPLRIDPFVGAGRILIGGPPRSGRSTLLRSLLAQAVHGGLRTVVSAPARSPLAADARRAPVRLIDPADRTSVLGAPPAQPTLLLVDDSETLVDAAVGEELVSWMRASDAPLAAVVAGRADDLATTYRGVAAEVRRSHCGILLRPGPVDGELLGVRLPRRASAGPPGRGVIVGDPCWGDVFAEGDAVPIQVAQP